MKGKDDTCNDQVYLLLWWWYLFLTIMGLLRLLQRVGLLSSSFRLFLLLLKLRLDFDTSSNGELVKDFIKRSAIGDWFVLYQMSKNLNQSLFFQFLVKLAVKPAVASMEGSEGTVCKAKAKAKVKENGGKKAEERWSSFVSFATGPAPVLRHDNASCEEPTWRSRRRCSSDEEEDEEPVSIS